MADLSIDSVWRETWAAAREHMSAFAALAAAFIFLPQLAVALWLPRITPPLLAGRAAGTGQAVPPAALAQALGGFIGPLLLIVLLVLALQTIATLTIVAVTADPARPAHETVGRTLARMLAPAARYVGASLMIGLALGVVIMLIAIAASLMAGVSTAAAGPALNTAVGGILLMLFLPFLGLTLWLGARILPLAGVFAVERAGVTGGIARAWALSRGRAWRIVAILLVFVLASVVVGLAVQGVGAALGVTAALATGRAVGNTALQIVSALVNAGVAMLFIVATGVIYRRLATARG